MSRFSRSVILGLSIVFTTFGCQKKSDDDKTTTNTNTNTTITPTTPELEITSPVKAFDFMAAAITSITTLNKDDAASIAKTLPGGTTGRVLRLDEETVHPDDAKCSLHNGAWDAATGKLMEITDSRWAGRSFYCFLRVNGYNPETIQGVYSIVQVFVCLLDEANVTYTTEEQTLNVTVQRSSPCFDSWPAWAKASQLPEDGTKVAMKYQKLEDNAEGWQYKWTVVADTDEVYYLQYTSTSIAFAKVPPAAQINSTVGTYGITINYATGLARYEACWGNGGRHVRFLATGELDATTGAYTAINSLQGINLGGGSVSTIKGSVEDGFRTVGYNLGISENEASSAWVKLSKFQDGESVHCVPSSKTCEGNDGFKVTTAEDLDFFKFSSAYPTEKAEVINFQKAIEPLDFETVTFSLVP